MIIVNKIKVMSPPPKNIVVAVTIIDDAPPTGCGLIKKTFQLTTEEVTDSDANRIVELLKREEIK